MSMFYKLSTFGYKLLKSGCFTYFGMFCKFFVEIVVFVPFLTEDLFFGGQVSEIKIYRRMSLVCTFMEIFVNLQNDLCIPHGSIYSQLRTKDTSDQKFFRVRERKM